MSLHYNPLAMPHVSVIVLNWNGKHLLELCLPSVLSQDLRDYEVVLFDNGSTDGSVEWVRRHYPAVRLMRSERNLGFARGNNEAIRATEAPYVVLLNNDADPAPGWLSELVRAAESAPEVGMCASKMVRASDPSIMDACGIEVDRAGIGWNRYSSEPDRPDETAPYEVFGPCAGAALYRRAMLDQVGLLDEDYFIYYEDIDLAWRAQRAGWRCLYVPLAQVTHRHSSTTKEGSPFKEYLLGRNKVWTLIKNYPWPNWLAYLPAILAYDTGAWGYALLRGDVHPARGRLAALKQFGAALRKRRTIQAAGRRVHLSPVKNPVRLLRAHRSHQRASGTQIVADER
jgi:GT2 family glycosyltransferase